MHRLATWPCLLWLAWAPAATDGGMTMEERVESVRSTVLSVLAADNRGDVDALRSLYAKDAVWMPPSGDVIEGREAILERYELAFATHEMELRGRSVQTRVAGDWAFDRGVTNGTLRPRDGGTPITVDDKYLMVLRRRDDGAWQVAVLAWSPRAPGGRGRDDRPAKTREDEGEHADLSGSREDEPEEGEERAR